jgi:hypothetical protein
MNILAHRLLRRGKHNRRYRKSSAALKFLVQHLGQGVIV